jgi:hypothetical protein
MAQIKTNAALNIYKNWEKKDWKTYSYWGSRPVSILTTITNNGKYSNLVKIAECVDDEGIYKSDIIHIIFPHVKEENLSVSGYYATYFSYLNSRDIISYSRKTRKWHRGINYQQFLNDAEVLQNEWKASRKNANK